MSLTVGARMVRQDDGMRGVVEMVDVTASGQYQEPRVVYMDRGERRIAPKKEKWEPEAPPPRKLTFEEIRRVAEGADNLLRWIDKNETPKWWQLPVGPGTEMMRAHDPVLVRLIAEYLAKRA